MNRRTPTLGAIVQHLRARRGLLLLGAGASAGQVPFGWRSMAAPGFAYMLGGGFPAVPPPQSDLTRRIVAAVGDDPAFVMSILAPGRTIRHGTSDFPFKELLRRLPNHFARTSMLHALAKSAFAGECSDNYSALNTFHPGTVLNYNLDGLAAQVCGHRHVVIDAHGTVPPAFGSPEMRSWLEEARDYDLPVPPDDILLCLPESYGDRQLARRLSLAFAPSPHFVAVIGYSFGRSSTGRDDHVSWDWFCCRFRDFAGNVYV